MLLKPSGSPKAQHIHGLSHSHTHTQKHTCTRAQPLTNSLPTTQSLVGPPRGLWASHYPEPHRSQEASLEEALPTDVQSQPGHSRSEMGPSTSVTTAGFGLAPLEPSRCIPAPEPSLSRHVFRETSPPPDLSLSETRLSPPAQSPRLRKGGGRRSWAEGGRPDSGPPALSHGHLFSVSSSL